MALLYCIVLYCIVYVFIIIDCKLFDFASIHQPITIFTDQIQMLIATVLPTIQVTVFINPELLPSASV